MSISDEAVEAAHIAANQKANLHTYVSEISVRAALEAALPHLSQGAVRMKPLEWGKYPSLNRGRKLVATDCFGMEYARLDLEDQSPDEIEEYKARVQAEYNRAALSALSPAPVGVTDEMVELAVNAYSKARAPFWVDGVMYIGDVSRGVRAALEAALTSHEPGPCDDQMYLIRKGGAYYRPNAQGYTTVVAEAGRFTLDEAIRHSHPNGPDGWRDGISYYPAPTDTQERVSESGEVLGWSWSWGPEGKRVYDAERPDERQFPGKYHDLAPLVRQSALTACQQEVERLRDEADYYAGKWGQDTIKLEARNAELVKALEKIAEIDRESYSVGQASRGMDDVGKIARATLGGQSNG